MAPDRSHGQKLLDNIFSDVPFNVLTSDTGMGLKYLKGINEALDRHQRVTEHALVHPAPQHVIVERAPEYLPQPEVLVNMEEIARGQREAVDKLDAVFGAQRDLVEAARSHTPLLQRMVRNQGVSNNLLVEQNAACDQGNQIALHAAVTAFQQRNQQIDQLAQLIVRSEDIADGLDQVGATIEHQAHATRDLLLQLMTDVGDKITDMTNEQVLTRMSLLQALFAIRTTFLQTHEQQMMTQQEQLLVAKQTAEWTRMTEKQKESHYQWQRAEVRRAMASTREDFEAVLGMLGHAQELDDINPEVYLSLGTIHSALEQPEVAAAAFATADVLTRDAPRVQSYTLMNLAGNLLKIQRQEHAERAMRRATKIDPKNLEVWFLYGKTAWLSGKKDSAIQVMKMLIAVNPAYYKAQIAADPSLEDLSQALYG